MCDQGGACKAIERHEQALLRVLRGGSALVIERDDARELVVAIDWVDGNAGAVMPSHENRAS